MLVRRGWPVAVFAHQLNFAIMKRLKTGPVPGMDHHRISQMITHVLHHLELAELIER